eukprot:Anaeramoba_ignava/a101170_5.p1 GENE.a101170_5~~a101170_5.p1  ORF type:complete len:167 (-),score=0.78 a101170_5:4-504(-)
MDNKIPHILHVFDGFRCGGTELRTCKIINGLGNKFHHTICSINGNFDAAAYINPDIEYSLIHCPQKGIIYPVQIINIYKKLRQIKPDLLIAYAWGSIDWLIANLFDQVCPSIHAAEGFDDSEIRSEKYHRKLIRGFVFKRCCLIVTCSRLLKDMATDSWNVKKKKK